MLLLSSSTSRSAGPRPLPGEGTSSEGSRTILLPEDVLSEGFGEEAAPVEAGACGYVQEIDTDGLVAFAAEREAVVELLHGRGSFVVEGGPLARLQEVPRPTLRLVPTRFAGPGPRL